MRVLLSERCFDGHRKTYMKWLSAIEHIEFFVLAPENFGVNDDRFFRYEPQADLKNYKAYQSWIAQIREIVKENQIDVVHILDGDSIMRFFGLGFSKLGTKKIVITYHHFFPGLLRSISYRAMCFGNNRVSVAHTHSVQKALQRIHIPSVVQCEYPSFAFQSIEKRDPLICKKHFGLKLSSPTIGIVGGMSKYKNILPFLNTLQKSEADFQLLICGKPGGVSEEEIYSAVKPYSHKVKLRLQKLSDEEYEEAIAASDIIYCLYNHDFDGASGPLTDGVCAGKMILACKHGSLGAITTQNLLGVTAECDDPHEMLSQTEFALSIADHFTYSEKALRYREHLKPENFQD